MSEVSLVLASSSGVSVDEVFVIFGVSARYSSFFTLLCLSLGGHNALQNAVVVAVEIINMDRDQRLVVGSKVTHVLEGIGVQLSMYRSV